MDILAYLNKYYPHFIFSISKMYCDCIKICTKETYDAGKEYFHDFPVKIFYIECPDEYEFGHVENKTVPCDMTQYYISETERVLKYQIRRLKIKEILS